MIKVIHEKIETVTEEMGFVSVNAYLLGYPLYLRVPIDLPEENAKILEIRATRRVDKYMHEHCTTL